MIPVMWSPFPQNIQWADAVFLLLLLAWLFSGYAATFRPVKLDYLVLAYLTASAVSLLNVEGSGRQSVELLKLCYLGLVYVTVGTLCRNAGLLESTTRWIGGASLVVSSAGLLYLLASGIASLPDKPFGVRMHTPYLGEVLRLQATFPGPELLGNFLTAGLPFVLALMVSSDRHRGLLRAGILVIAVAGLFTFSHSWVGLAAAGLTFTWPLFAGGAWRMVRAMLAAAVSLLFAAMLFVSTVYVGEVSVDRRPGPPPSAPVPVHARVSPDQWRHLDIQMTYSYVSYHLLKVLALEVFLAHPLIGVGRGNFDSVSTPAAAAGRLVDNFEGIHPHMTILGQFAETGLLGGAALLALWAGAFTAASCLWRNEEDAGRRWMARAVLAALAGLFINGLYTDVMNFRFLWVALALLRSLSTNKEQAAPSGQP